MRVIHRREMDRSLMYLSIRDGSLLDIFERSILSFPHFHVLRVFEGKNFFWLYNQIRESKGSLFSGAYELILLLTRRYVKLHVSSPNCHNVYHTSEGRNRPGKSDSFIP